MGVLVWSPEYLVISTNLAVIKPCDLKCAMVGCWGTLLSGDIRAYRRRVGMCSALRPEHRGLVL